MNDLGYYTQKNCVLDLYSELRTYQQVLDDLMHDNQLAPLGASDRRHLVEESLRQIFQDSMHSEFETFSSNIAQRPDLRLLGLGDLISIMPDGKIRLEKAWKELALACYMSCQVYGLFHNERSTGYGGFSFVLRTVYRDGVYLEYYTPSQMGYNF